MGIQLKKDHDVVTLLAEATTVGGVLDVDGSSVRLPGMVNAVVFALDVSAAQTDAGDTLDVKIQTKLDGTNWIDVVHFTQLAGNGGAKRHVAKLMADTAQAMFASSAALGAGNIRHLLGDEWRVNYVQAETNDASYTFSVTACPM